MWCDLASMGFLTFLTFLLCETHAHCQWPRMQLSVFIVTLHTHSVTVSTRRWSLLLSSPASLKKGENRPSSDQTLPAVLSPSSSVTPRWARDCTSATWREFFSCAMEANHISINVFKHTCTFRPKIWSIIRMFYRWRRRPLHQRNENRKGTLPPTS